MKLPLWMYVAAVKLLAPIPPLGAWNVFQFVSELANPPAASTKALVFSATVVKGEAVPLMPPAHIITSFAPKLSLVRTTGKFP